jgi:hypothetical protein
MDNLFYKIIAIAFVIVSLAQMYLINVYKGYVNTQNNYIVELENVNSLQDRLLNSK